MESLRKAFLSNGSDMARLSQTQKVGVSLTTKHLCCPMLWLSLKGVTQARSEALRYPFMRRTSRTAACPETGKQRVQNALERQLGALC